MFFLIAILLGSVAVVLAGLRRGRVREFFDWTTILAAPLGVFERAFSTYWALYWYLTLGGYPFGDRILSRGVGRDWFAGGRNVSQAMTRRPNE